MPKPAPLAFLLQTALVLGLASAPASAGFTKRFDWSLKTPAGESVSLSSFKGKVVLVVFWTTTCGPCHAAKPFFEELQARFAGRGLVVLSVNVKEKPEIVRKWLLAHPTTLTTLLDPEGKIEDALDLDGQPAMALFDTSDSLNWSAAGISRTTKDDLAARIDFMAPGAPGSVPVGTLK
jgi:thiol-disulfide isomerase/thioredoxin